MKRALGAGLLCASILGSLSYAYLTLGYDISLVDAVAAALARSAPHVKLVGYRELIALTQQKSAADRMRQRLRDAAAELQGSLVRVSVRVTLTLTLT